MKDRLTCVLQVRRLWFCWDSCTNWMGVNCEVRQSSRECAIFCVTFPIFTNLIYKEVKL